MNRARMLSRRAVVGAVLFATLLAACSSAEVRPAAESDSAPATESSTTSTSTTTSPPTTTATTETVGEDSELSPLAELVTPAGSALYDPADSLDDAPEPVSISITRLEVEGADVISVGVEPNGEMEIPSAPEDVGWYRFNPKPGQEGSSVLAGHINYNGTNGVFRHLSRLEVGDEVIIGYEDGSESRFEVVERAQYNKQELPLDRIFTKTGDPVLTLITCGGSFNSSLRSYEDNFVVYAIPAQA